MAKQEVPLHVLNTYLPRGAYIYVERYLSKYKVELTVTRERSSVLGNYQGGYTGKNHRISINGNLNRYAFLITLLHELGHMMAFDRFGPRIPAHGTQWKCEYKKILSNFLTQQLFPRDIRDELLRTLENPAASSCAETSLVRVLRKYDSPKPDHFLLEELPEESYFKTKNGLLFKKMGKKRIRILARDESTHRYFLFSPVAEVKLVKKKII